MAGTDMAAGSKFPPKWDTVHVRQARGLLVRGLELKFLEIWDSQILGGSDRSPKIIKWLHKSSELAPNDFL